MLRDRTEKHMNVYDFDKTIFDGDSTFHFYLYCVRHRPAVLLSLPRTVWFGAGYALGLCPKLRFKEQFYRFLRHIDDIDGVIGRFWEENQPRIKEWYLRQKREDDVIISASPEFLLRPVGEMLGVTLMASVVDPHTGRYTGVNCDSSEKVRRLFERFPDAHVEEFYSDSHIDDPLAAIADRAFLVTGDTLSAWE